MIIIFMTINTLACVQNNMPSNGVCLPMATSRGLL